MHPLSIILVFVFFGSLVVLGAVLLRIGLSKLREQVHVGIATRSRRVTLFWHTFTMALGLLLVAYGIFGTYRIIWVT